jgi:histone-lysine N-methyltransferase SETD3
MQATLGINPRQCCTFSVNKTCKITLTSRPIQSSTLHLRGNKLASKTNTSSPRAKSSALPRIIAAAAATSSDVDQLVTNHDALIRWCIEDHSLPATCLQPEAVEDELDRSEKAFGFTASRDVAKSEVILEIPGDLAVTSVDVGKDEMLSALAEGRSELVGLALFLMQERSRGASSAWAPLLATLPSCTNSPVLWDDAERADCLNGSPVLEEARSREAALLAEWESIQTTAGTAGISLDSGTFNARAFLEAMSVILSAAAYLPSAQCFALLPLVGSLRRTGSAGGAVLDYDFDRQSVTLVSSRPYTRGQEVRLYDGRPSGEVLLATGSIEPANPADCLILPASLVAADRLYSQKKEILENFGFTISEEFPIFEDRMATQHLAYMRLARLTDPAQFIKISFEQDVIITPENEYEVLQLVMADLRDRMQAYPNNFEDDLKDLQRNDLTRRQRLAAVLKVSEKRILRGTMDGVRRRLAPIRGIPTKSGGLQDPNADFKEMFDMFESIPSAPKRLFDSLSSWARGDEDPDWKKKNGGGGGGQQR